MVDKFKHFYFKSAQQWASQMNPDLVQQMRERMNIRKIIFFI